MKLFSVNPPKFIAGAGEACIFSCWMDRLQNTDLRSSCIEGFVAKVTARLTDEHSVLGWSSVTRQQSPAHAHTVPGGPDRVQSSVPTALASTAALHRNMWLQCPSPDKQ